MVIAVGQGGSWTQLETPRSHILKACWVLTWKNVGTEGTEKEPKARLRVLGYTDPRLTTLETSALPWQATHPSAET